MKRNKTMIVAALAIVLTLAVGYALFSQTINITGTATAQGSFEFTSVCTIGIDSGLATEENKPAEVVSIMNNWNTMMGKTGDRVWPNVIGGSSDNSCTVSGNNVTMSSTLAYPGAMQIFTVKVTNTGTISGKLIPDNLINHGETGSGPADGDFVAAYIGGSNVFPNSSTQEALLGVMTTIGGHEFVPNEVSYYVYALVWPGEDSTECAGGSACTRTLTFSLPFEQYNQ